MKKGEFLTAMKKPFSPKKENFFITVRNLFSLKPEINYLCPKNNCKVVTLANL